MKIFNTYIIMVLLALLVRQVATAQCPPHLGELRIEVDADANYFENFWSVIDPEKFEFNAGDFFKSSLPRVVKVCVPKGKCLMFLLSDDGGDGFAGGGSLRVFFENDLIFESSDGMFGANVVQRFGCQPGEFCDTALPTSLGEHTTPDGRETWLQFTPTQTGRYEIATCHPDNACPTKIWVYSFCKNLFVSGNQAGAIAFAEAGCAEGARTSVFWEAGKTYFIRLKYRYFDCPAERPIHFSIDFKGAISGCMDSTACNFNPLATLPDTCFFDGLPCLRAPDLITDEDRLRKSLDTKILLNADNCAVEEGCLRGFGERHLIVFDTRISNIGNEDFYLGNTPNLPTDTSSQFIFDPCHQHWHYRGYAEYLLFDQQGNAVPIGQKNGFCVFDLECYNGTFGKYTCDKMGISANCGDLYDRDLPCQWIDVTGVPAGFYTLVVRVNWDRKPDKNGRLELNWDNNWAQACFELNYLNGVPEIEQQQNCPKYTDCAGIVFGNTTSDCTGNCGGATLHGDWDADHRRTTDDVKRYLTEALADTAAITVCRDLFADGNLNVFDAALLQECVLHAQQPAHWGNRYPCQFPTGWGNPTDLVQLRLTNLDTVAQTVLVQIANPVELQMGFELQIEGLQIEGVECLVAGFNAALHFDNSGEIIALAADESSVKKHNVFSNFLKIKYSQLTAPKICLRTPPIFVNKKYQLANAVLSTPTCLETGISNASFLTDKMIDLLVFPSPSSDGQAQVFFENPNSEPFSAQLIDVWGRVVGQWHDLRSDSFSIDLRQQPAGVYQIQLQFSQKLGIARLVHRQ